MDIKQNADGSMGFYSDQEGKELAKVGGPKTPAGGPAASANFRIPTVYHIPLTGVASSPFTAGIANVVLSQNDDLVIQKSVVFISSTAPACTIDVGFAASMGVTASTTLNSGLVTTALITTAGSGGTSALETKLPAGSAIAVTPQSATCATFAGDLYITAYKA